MSKLRLHLLVSVILFGGVLSARAATLPRTEMRMAVSALESKSLSLDEAVAMVEAKYKARALRSNTVEEEGRKIHYIRLITADRSRVFTVRIDAATGREL